MWIDSTRIDQCMEYYRNHALDGIGICSYHGYKKNEIEFLKEHTYVKGVVFTDAKSIDISPIKLLKKLIYINF